MADGGNAARSESMFGDYDIIETIGQGGMGVVYRAFDAQLGRVVALKVLKEDLRGNKQVNARFQREGQAFASLNHPNIVHIYSVGSVGRIPYIAMEYIDGEPLSKIMRREKRIEWKRAFSISEQIAAALASAHEALIIHRDIKPGNILVDKSEHAFVTDFGIAKVLTAETQLTVEGSRLGTPQYMSPERCMNREITASSDIYSLGVLLFQMISGRLPYEGSNPIDLIQKIVTDPPRRLSEFMPGISEDVERLVAYMIEKKPQDRPSDAHELVEMLQSVREGKGLPDVGGNISSSLESFRDSEPTPHSSGSSYSDFDAATPMSFARKAVARWTGLSESLRMAMVGVIIIAGCAVIGFRLSDVLNAGYALDAVRDTDVTTDAWSRSATVADFMAETEGVRVANINLPGFVATSFAFSDPDHLVIQLDGRPASARKGQSAMIVLRPQSRSAYMAIEPKQAIAPGSPFELLDARPETYLLARAGRTGEHTGLFASPILAERSGPGTRLLTIEDGRLADAGLKLKSFGPASYLNDSTLIVGLVEDTARNSASLWRVPLRTRASTETPIQLDAGGSPIQWIRVSPDGRNVYYARAKNKDQYEIWQAVPRGAAWPEAPIFSGSGRITPDSLRPDSRRLLVAHTDAQGESRMSVASIDRTIAADLGPIVAAAWRPNASQVIAAVNDRKGNTQLWAIDPDDPTNRKQLTYLADGTSSLCGVSPDGRWAVASISRGQHPAIIVVDLDALLSQSD